MTAAAAAAAPGSGCATFLRGEVGTELPGNEQPGLHDAATPATYRRSISAVVVRRALEASIAKSTET